jgi:hypothetical protein
MQISWLFDGPEDLLASRGDRRRWAEASIRELARCCALQPSPTAGSAQIWGTDGSVIPASATLCESRHVTAAATGPSTFYLTWGVNGPHCSAGSSPGRRTDSTLLLRSPKFRRPHRRHPHSGMPRIPAAEHEGGPIIDGSSSLLVRDAPS